MRGLLLAVALGCTAPAEVFVCSGAGACDNGGEPGVCEANGYCSFADATCPSGRRYGQFAGGGLAGACVGAPGPDAPPAGPMCGNGRDDDGDGAIDLADPGCDSLEDVSEKGALACDDGLDNDLDGAYDHPADPGCAGPDDDAEKCEPGAGCPQCDDGVDQLTGDLDLAIDYRLDDTGDVECFAPSDDDEGGRTACEEGQDADGDGLITFNDDTGCAGWGDGTEHGTDVCDNGVDDDGDGRVDFRTSLAGDPGCASPTDGDERGDAACDNGLDDDADGSADFRWDGLGDWDCADPADATE